MMTNKVITQESRYANYMCDKPKCLKQKLIKKTGWNNINLKISIH